MEPEDITGPDEGVILVERIITTTRIFSEYGRDEGGQETVVETYRRIAG